MKCYKCGYENEEDNLFCIKCGNKIEYEPETSIDSSVDPKNQTAGGKRSKSVIIGISFIFILLLGAAALYFSCIKKENISDTNSSDIADLNNTSIVNESGQTILTDETSDQKDPLSYDFSEIYDFNIYDIMSEPQNNTDKIFQFNACIKEIYANDPNNGTMSFIVNAQTAPTYIYEEAVISVDTTEFDYITDLDTKYCYQHGKENSAFFYGVYTGNNKTIMSLEDPNENIVVPEIKILKIEDTGDLTFKSDRNYKDFNSEINSMIEDIEKSPRNKISSSYNFEDCWYSIEMTVQKVIFEDERCYCYIEGIIDSSAITIEVFEPAANEEILECENMINSQKKIKARFWNASKCDDDPNADYSFIFCADSLTDALS